MLKSSLWNTEVIHKGLLNICEIEYANKMSWKILKFSHILYLTYPNANESIM